MKTFRNCLAFLLAVIIISGNIPYKLLPEAGEGAKGIFTVRAAAVDEDIYNYTLLNGNATIISLKQNISGNIVLPATLDGYPVTGIGYNVFYNVRYSITSVTIPVGYTHIGQSAFSGCIYITAVSLPTGLLSIGNSAFKDCSKLASIVIPDSVTEFGDSVFENCTLLTDAVLGNGIQSIGTRAFYACTSLRNVTLPSGLKSIGDHAFNGCDWLQAVTFPATVETIGEYAFMGCYWIRSLVIPNSVTSIGKGAFYSCTLLNSLTLSDSLTEISEQAFCNCPYLTSVTIPSGVGAIGIGAFQDCTRLSNLTLPNGLQTIGESAFLFCHGLTVVEIPNTVHTLGRQAFSTCQNLIAVTIPDSVVTFGTNIFNNSLNVTVYCNIDSEAEYYAYNNSIPYLYIAPFTIEFDANGGMGGTIVTQNCGTALTAPAVTKIGYTLTGWAPAVPPATPAENITYYAQWTVNKYTITFDANGGIGGKSTLMSWGAALVPPVVTRELYLFNGWVPSVPMNVPLGDATYIAQWVPIYSYTISGGEVTITGCNTGVTGAVIIPDEFEGCPVTGIGYQAFQNCTGITGITIPASVTFIDARAFMGCTGLTAVTIPAGVTSIGNQAFQDCTALASITVPTSLAGIGGAAFANTAWMNAKPDGPVTIGSVFYRYKGTMPAGTTVTVSTGTLGIAGGAFSGCTGLTAVDLPETLTTIGANAFSGCTGLGRTVIPQSVTAIGAQAFNNCTAMTYCCYPDSYGHVYAAANDIPHTLVVKITFDANGGSGGTSTAMAIGSALSAPTVTRSSFVFNGWSPALPATVPEEPVTYVAQWTTVFSYTVKESIATVTGTNTAISGEQEIPAALGGYPVKNIGEAAFRNMTGITSMTIPDGMLTIGGGAFDGCSGLTTVIIPASVRDIGTNAFRGCPGLTLYVYPRSRAMLYAENNHLNYRVFVTVTFSLNGGTGTVPAPQSGLDGDEVIIPPQGDITRTGYHYLGWAPSPTATEAFANFTMPPDNITLYAVWSRIPAISPFSGAATIINTQSNYIYGLASGITQAEFESGYIAITGNGRLEYTLPSGGFGTGTQVKVIDNITGLAVQIFTIIIFGDLNGDGSIDSMDAGKAVDFENYLEPWVPADDALYIKAGDLNGDGSVDSLDAGKIVDAENYIITVDQVTGLA